ncbi:MAG TPA: fatty acyl-AMP ligase [Polyangiaceae bacterium]|nr:fatty acyl-AMP ligase [Polyangiaceae bacterium]
MSDLTIGEALEEAAKRAEPTRGYTFVRDEGQAEPFFSFAGVERASGRYGGALQALGLRRGDRVALVLPESDEFIFTFLGALRAGLVPVPMYPPLGLGQLAGYLDNAKHIVGRSGARALVTTSNIKRLLGTVEAACPTLRSVVAVEAIRSAREALRPAKVGPDDVAFLQFTSGSTSRPKGVMLTHANIAANVRAICREGLGLREGDVGVSWLPLYHDMGLIGFVLAPLYERIPVALLSPFAFLRRPALWLRALGRHRGTVSYGPNFAYALCVKRVRPRELEGIDLSAWRVAGCGAEPVRAETLRAFEEAFSPFGFSPKAFVASYGLAESTLAAAFSPVGQGARVDVVHGPTLWQDGMARPVSRDHDEAVELVRCGRPFEGHQIAAFAEDDAESERPLPERVVGELRLKGPSTMRGYFDDRDLSASAMAGGWLRTGDLGYVADGEVVPCGRSKEVIIVNGRNFYPHDIEWFSGQVEGVRKGNIAAFGVDGPAGDRERVVVVFETPLMGERERVVLAGRVRSAVQEGLGLTVDDAVAVAPGVLPKTSSGKLQRLLARRLYLAKALSGRDPPRAQDRLDLAKELLRSQLSYVATRTLGQRPAR